MTLRDWPITFKIAVPFLCLLGIAMIVGVAIGKSDAERRRDYARDNGETTDGPDDTTLVPYSVGCRIVAADPDVARLGFEFVKCNDDTVVMVSR